MWFSVRGQKGSDLDQTRSSLIALKYSCNIMFYCHLLFKLSHEFLFTILHSVYE